MSDFEILIPKLGESIQEATITKIFVKKGDSVNEDDILFEVATDKVDSEIPSPVAGVVKEIFYAENDLVPVGKVAMIINLEGDAQNVAGEPETKASPVASEENSRPGVLYKAGSEKKTHSDRFLSPLVKTIASREGIPLEVLEKVEGSGLGGRIQKNDLLSFIEQQKNMSGRASSRSVSSAPSPAEPQPTVSRAPISIGADDTIIEMDRVRKLIANHMVMSKQVSPHVTTFIEADVTNIVLWRNKVKDSYLSRYGEKLTYMPIFTEAVAQALVEFPGVNASVDGDKIILRKHVNIGIAVATNSGNLVVPVVKDAGMKNLLGLTSEINLLAKAGRDEKLTADHLMGGTFTITNFGSFGNLGGTPIINQPQVAILAVGTIEKKPAVMATPTGDAIVIRHKMFLSLSYDHRVVDGMLGGKFLRRIADLLEEFDIDRII